MASTFKFGNKNWAVKKDSVLAYNDENNNYKPLPFDFTRDSTATYVDSDGLIKTASNNEARIDYLDNANGHLLLEPSSTNVITYSNDFTQSSWVKLAAGTGTAAAITADYAISPDGTQNASRLVCDLNGGTTTADQSLIYDLDATSTTKTISIYMKSNTGSNQTLYFSNTFTGDSTDEALVTTEWKRFTFSHNTSNHTFSLGLRGGTGSDDTADVLIYAAQAESGSYATSYIPTNGSSVTRAADVCEGAGNSEVFNDSEGVLYTEIAAASKTSSNYDSISITDGSASDKVQLYFTPTSNQLYYIVISGSSNQAAAFTTLTNATEFNKIAIKYKANDFALWVNGVEVLTDTSGNAPSGLNTLNFDNGTGSNDFYGKTKEIRVYDTALTDAELITLTT